MREEIVIEPGQAFGTGAHASTRLCLELLLCLAMHEPRGALLDIGTGSGVLAIAAARELRRRAIASDIDPVAVCVARANVRLNGALSLIEVVRADGLSTQRLHRRYDLIFANILLDPVRRLATPIARNLAPGGHVVLSGLLRNQAVAALAPYVARGLILKARIPLEGWMTLVLQRPKRAVAARRSSQ